MTSQGGATLAVGVAGLGMAGGGILRTLRQVPGIEIVAAADPRSEARSAFHEELGGRTYADFAALCGDSEVEAIWIATPTADHREHAIVAARAGKHCVVEKPFAASLDAAAEMIDVAQRHKVALLAGGVRSLEPAFAEMRRVIGSGRLGSLGALNTWVFNGWMLRPREPQELDVATGGGAVHNQAPHSVDVLRLLGGGLVRSVRGMTARWMAERPCPGYFTAYLEFEDGLPATITYNGHGYLEGWELLPWGETAKRQAASDAAYRYRTRLRRGIDDEREARELLRFGGGGPALGPAGEDWVPSDAGIVIASCERGEVRQSATGLYVYDDDGRHDEPLPAQASLRLNEVTELRQAISGRSRPTHDGRWGMATLEVVLAIMQSGSERREIMLHHQVAVPAEPLQTVQPEMAGPRVPT